MKKPRFGLSFARGVIIFYILIVLGFAFAYSLAWKLNPDSFIVNEQFNLFPASELRSLLEENGTNTIPPNTETVFQNKDIQSAVTQICTEKALLRSQSDELKVQLKKQKVLERESHEKHMQAWSDNKKAYEAKELAPLLAEEAKLSNVIVAAQAALDSVNDPIQRLPLVAAHGDAKVKFAEFQVRLAEKKYQISSSILANLGAFNDSVLVGESMSEYAKVGELEQAIDKNDADQRAVRSKAWGLNDKIRSQQLKRLGFEDFLYFSFGVSTTSTFGDITPNSRGVRRLVTMQLLICTILVGLFVTHLGNRFLPKDNDSSTRR